MLAVIHNDLIGGHNLSGYFRAFFLGFIARIWMPFFDEVSIGRLNLFHGGPFGQFKQPSCVSDFLILFHFSSHLQDLKLSGNWL